MKERPLKEMVKLLITHKTECRALNAVQVGHWSSPWYLNTYDKLKVLKASKICCHRGKDYHWVVFRCNDPDCPAQLVIRRDALEDYAESLAKQLLISEE